MKVSNKFYSKTRLLKVEIWAIFFKDCYFLVLFLELYWTTKITHHFSNAFNMALTLNFCVLKVTNATVFNSMLLLLSLIKSRLLFAKLKFLQWFWFCFVIKMPVYKPEVNKLVRIFFCWKIDCFSPRGYGLAVKTHNKSCTILSWGNFKTILQNLWLFFRKRTFFQNGNKISF